MTYRQMGLLDEAVAEFRLASRSPALRSWHSVCWAALSSNGDFGAAIAELGEALAVTSLPIDARSTSVTTLAWHWKLRAVWWRRWSSSSTSSEQTHYR
jgi:hypothetical protein